MLTRRIFSLPYSRQEYNKRMDALFINNNPINRNFILNDIINYTNDISNNADKAILHEYNTFSSYDSFLEEKKRVLNFLYMQQVDHQNWYIHI